METVRLPGVMRDYACQRSLVCCSRPWRVPMHPWEPGLMRGRLLSRGAVALTDRFEASVTEENGRPMLTQNAAGRCDMLDVGGASGPSCSIQKEAGLQTLLPACRNFPRSVAQTPHGVEAAFQLNCPTAASIVARTPEAFSWITVEESAWPYAPTFFVDDEVPWIGGRSVPFAQVEALREAWWARLAEAEDVVGTLGALLLRPAEPENPRLSSLDDLPRDVGERVSEPALAHLGRLGSRGDSYRAAHGRLRKSLGRDLDLGAARAAAQSQRAAFLCAVGLAIQTAGVHHNHPAVDRLGMVAWQGLCAVWLFEAIRHEPGLSELDALQDAINATANLSASSA